MHSKKIYIFILLICSVLRLQAQLIKIPASKNNSKNVEALLLQNKDFGHDTLSLKNFLSPLKTSQFKVVYHAMLANGYCHVFDEINDQSNAHYLESIALAKKSNNLALKIWTQLNYISYLYNYRNYNQLTPLLLEVLNQKQNIVPAEMIFPGESFKKTGWILQSLGDYETAATYLKLAENYTSKNTSEYASILNAIGTNYFKTNDSKKAAYYYYKTALLAEQIKDTLRHAKALGDLALVYKKQNNYKKAISLVKKDISLSESCNDDKNTMYATILLSELYIESNKLHEAEELLAKALVIARSKNYYNISEFKIITLQLVILQKQHKVNDELILRRRLATLENSLKTKDGDVAISNNNWILNKAKFEQKIIHAKVQKQQESFFKNLYAMIAILLAVVALFIYFRFKKRFKNRQLEYSQKVISLEMDKLKMEQKLSEAHEDLNTQIDYLKDKNIQIKKLKSEINSVKNSSSHYLEEKNGKLTALLESHLMTENNWRIFKREFEKEYPDFYKMLMTDFKEITDSNMRILLLQKLDFSTNEIAELLGVTTEAIKKSKQRLKKKLGIKYQELYTNLSTAI